MHWKHRPETGSAAAATKPGGALPKRLSDPAMHPAAAGPWELLGAMPLSASKHPAMPQQEMAILPYYPERIANNGFGCEAVGEKLENSRSTALGDETLGKREC